MKLLRIASAYFEPPPEGWKSWSLALGNVNISTIPVSEAHLIEGKFRLVLQASTEIAFPDINDEGYLILPQDKRRELESGLETAVDLLAVFGHCSRTLSSTSPSVALLPDSDGERAQLESSKGFLVNRTSTVSAHSQIPIEPELLQGLGDRLDGVALMAEAHSHGLESGRFREYVRLFESGFAKPFSQMSKKLAQFLHPRYGYTRSEVVSWIEMRDPLTHADRIHSDGILLDSDIRKVTQRMEQAAYDVLFNKTDWHLWSKKRRQLWVPPAASTSASTDVIARRGSALSLRFQVFDEFGVFPKDLKCVFNPPPAEWWCKFPDVDDGQAIVAIKTT